MPDRDLVWNSESDRYEWAVVNYDPVCDYHIACFDDGRVTALPRDRSAYPAIMSNLAPRPTATEIRLAYGAKFTRPEVAVVMAENLASRGLTWPAGEPPALARPKHRTFWRALRRLARRLLRRYRPRPAARPVRASVIHRMGFGGLRA